MGEGVGFAVDVGVGLVGVGVGVDEGFCGAGLFMDRMYAPPETMAIMMISTMAASILEVAREEVWRRKIFVMAKLSFFSQVALSMNMKMSNKIML